MILGRCAILRPATAVFRFKGRDIQLEATRVARKREREKPIALLQSRGSSRNRVGADGC